MCDDDTMGLDSALRRFNDEQIALCASIGLDPTSAKTYGELLGKAGFVDIRVIHHFWPMNRWPKDKRYKELGQWTCANFTSGLSGFAMALRTRLWGWSEAQVEVSLVNVRKEMMDTSIHAYLPL